MMDTKKCVASLTSIALVAVFGYMSYELLTYQSDDDELLLLPQNAYSAVWKSGVYRFLSLGERMHLEREIPVLQVKENLRY